MQTGITGRAERQLNGGFCKGLRSSEILVAVMLGFDPSIFFIVVKEIADTWVKPEYDVCN